MLSEVRSLNVIYKLLDEILNKMDEILTLDNDTRLCVCACLCVHAIGCYLHMHISEGGTESSSVSQYPPLFH